MSGSSQHKKKFYFVKKAIEEHADSQHGISVNEIINYLKEEEIEAERKGIYHDVEVLKELGFAIENKKVNNQYKYFLNQRLFSFPELKLLVDAIHASHVVTPEMGKTLIDKLSTLTSKPSAKALQRQVYTNKYTKSMNQGMLENVDKIHHAMQNNKQLLMTYSKWSFEKKMELKNNGEQYKVSPWGLTWSNENYYLVAWDHDAKIYKHFRVDKIMHLEQTTESREHEIVDFNSYVEQHFNMFGGAETNVTLRCHMDIVNVIIDRFGRQLNFIKEDEEHFRVRVKVALSTQFYGWIFGLNHMVEIISPEEAVHQFQSMIQQQHQ